MSKGGSAPDNRDQMAELERQRKAAQENANRLADTNLAEANAQRRRQRGKSLLIGTSETGTNALGQ